MLNQFVAHFILCIVGHVDMYNIITIEIMAKTKKYNLN